MFIAMLFTIQESWKQHKCPTIGRQLDKLRYVPVMEYFIAIKISALKNLLWWDDKSDKMSNNNKVL